MKINLSEALGWKKTLSARYQELVQLRNQNAIERRNMYAFGDKNKEIVETPMYDVKKLDKQIAMLAREQRLLDMAIKRTNARTEVLDYEQDDTVLGELV